MVVDDEPDITTVVKRGLEAKGFVVDAFNKPEDALANFKPGVYDMLITDIRMPVMTGFDLYREIRKNDDKIKVAFMTAFEIYENEFRTIFKDIDVKSFFKKPISITSLTARINEELGRKQTQYRNR
jgi:two-component system, OmpR family, response regulator ChvI